MCQRDPSLTYTLRTVPLGLPCPCTGMANYAHSVEENVSEIMGWATVPLHVIRERHIAQSNGRLRAAACRAWCAVWETIRRRAINRGPINLFPS